MAELSSMVQGVSFDVTLAGTTLKAVIFAEALQVHFGADSEPESWLAAFYLHEVEIQTAAARAYRFGHDVVVLTTAAFNKD